MICTLFISVLAVLHLEYIHIWSFANDETERNPVCLNPECKKFAEYILKNMNKHVDPCHDFYDYVCQKWEQNHPQPEDESKWTVEHYMHQRALKNLRDVLNDPRVSKNSKVEDAKVLFRLCTHIPYLQEQDPTEIRKIILGIHDWPKFICAGEKLPENLYLWMIDNYYFKKTGNSAFFDYDMQVTLSGKNQIEVLFSAPDSVYGAIERMGEWDETQEKNYKNFLTHVIKSIIPGGTKMCMKKIASIVEKVFNFRAKLTEVARKSASEPHDEMTVKAAQEWHNALTQLVKYLRIHWLDYLNVLHTSERGSHHFSVEENQVIYVQRKYFINLAGLLAKTQTDTIVHHIHLYFAEAHMLLTRNMEVLLENSVSHHSPVTSFIKYEPERWKSCIEDHAMKETLGKMYAETYLSKKSTATIQNLMEKARDLIKIQVSRSSWLDSRTQDEIIEKIHQVKSIIGYSDMAQPFYKRKRQKPYVSPLTTEAKYIGPRNTIYVSALYLQTPIYAPDLPYVVNYGATVSMLGHELYHAIDEEGILTDARGITPWWKKEIITKFRNRMEYLVKQYNHLKLQEIMHHAVDHAIDESRTINEDIADLMGLKLAYMGYKYKLAQRKDVCPILPGFEKSGCEQLFFISYANAFCAASKDALTTSGTDVHSSQKIRVNGPVSNMKEFSRAFNCNKHDDMYRDYPFDLWQD